jgi:hypothetical protein
MTNCVRPSPASSSWCNDGGNPTRRTRAVRVCVFACATLCVIRDGAKSLFCSREADGNDCIAIAFSLPCAHLHFVCLLFPFLDTAKLETGNQSTLGVLTVGAARVLFFLPNETNYSCWVIPFPHIITRRCFVPLARLLVRCLHLTRKDAVSSVQ